RVVIECVTAFQVWRTYISKLYHPDVCRHAQNMVKVNRWQGINNLPPPSDKIFKQFHMRYGNIRPRGGHGFLYIDMPDPVQAYCVVQYLIDCAGQLQGCVKIYYNPHIFL